MAERVSSLLIDEAFSAGDANFIALLRSYSESLKLRTIADRWKKDPRPWAREQIFAYLDLPLNSPGHQTVVKHLFKQAEENRDDELLAVFLVAFDRSVRRLRRNRYHWDAAARTSYTEEILFTPRDKIPVGAVWNVQNRRLFSHHTRYYLRRRAWRYFRRIGFQRPASYVSAVAGALVRYRDEDFASGENILDNWGLIHACFGKHPALEIGAAKINLKEDRTLSELKPAPMFPLIWQARDAMPVLLNLVGLAKSRLVRVWAMTLLRQDHKDHLAGIPVADLLRLLDHDDDEVQQFAAELLDSAANLATLPIATWLELLKTRNITALETIAQLLTKYVAAERLDISQCVALATAEPVPVARQGLNLLKSKPIRNSDFPTLALLSRGRSAGVGRELSALALGILGTPANYDVDVVIRFFDSLTPSIRQGAWAWLTETSPGYNDPALWSRMIETPYDDLRASLVDLLRQRTALAGTGADRLADVWCPLLLNIHRGGRHKLIALRQVSDAIRATPQVAEKLLPVLAVAIRSVRPPEARGGLAAVVAAIEARPELQPLVARYLPELDLMPQSPARVPA